MEANFGFLTINSMDTRIMPLGKVECTGSTDGRTASISFDKLHSKRHRCVELHSCVMIFNTFCNAQTIMISTPEHMSKRTCTLAQSHAVTSRERETHTDRLTTPGFEMYVSDNRHAYQDTTGLDDDEDYCESDTAAKRLAVDLSLFSLRDAANVVSS